MPNLYIITGPAGVGKSTISKELAKSYNKSALIEGDDIYHQVIGGFVQAWKEGNHLKSVLLSLKKCLDLIYWENNHSIVDAYAKKASIS